MKTPEEIIQEIDERLTFKRHASKISVYKEIYKISITELESLKNWINE